MQRARSPEHCPHIRNEAVRPASRAIHSRVDETGEVAVGHDGAGQQVALLDGAWLGGSAEDAVQLVEGRLGPDAEAAQVTTRGQLQGQQGTTRRSQTRCLTCLRLLVP